MYMTLNFSLYESQSPCRPIPCVLICARICSQFNTVMTHSLCRLSDFPTLPPIAAKVYPIGIPLLYAFILWTNRHSLNPRTLPNTGSRPGGAKEEAVGARLPNKSGDYFANALERKRATNQSPNELQDLEERVRKRAENPDLAPSKFLWKDFGERLCWVFST